VSLGVENLDEVGGYRIRHTYVLEGCEGVREKEKKEPDPTKIWKDAKKGLKNRCCEWY